MLSNMSPYSISKALYNLNKEAKRARDLGEYGKMVKLYQIKDQVMDRLIEDGCMCCIGYHTDKSGNTLLAYGFCGYIFHKPASEGAGTYKGVLNKVSSQKNTLYAIKESQAAVLLTSYLEKKEAVM